ncbi:hypothetical protein ALC60_01837, partial [Trachymyrmex zeteki]
LRNLRCKIPGNSIIMHVDKARDSNFEILEREAATCTPVTMRCRMRNRETGLKVIVTTGEPAARNATSMTRDWHLLENDQGTSPTGIPSERRH